MCLTSPLIQLFGCYDTSASLVAKSDPPKNDVPGIRTPLRWVLPSASAPPARVFLSEVIVWKPPCFRSKNERNHLQNWTMFHSKRWKGPGVSEDSKKWVGTKRFNIEPRKIEWKPVKTPGCSFCQKIEGSSLIRRRCGPSKEFYRVPVLRSSAFKLDGSRHWVTHSRMGVRLVHPFTFSLKNIWLCQLRCLGTGTVSLLKNHAGWWNHPPSIINWETRFGSASRHEERSIGFLPANGELSKPGMSTLHE